MDERIQMLIPISIVIIFAIAVGILPKTAPGKDWVDLLSALGTPIVALLAVYIAYQQ